MVETNDRLCCSRLGSAAITIALSQALESQNTFQAFQQTARIFVKAYETEWKDLHNFQGSAPPLNKDSNPWAKRFPRLHAHHLAWEFEEVLATCLGAASKT